MYCESDRVAHGAPGDVVSVAFFLRPPVVEEFVFIMKVGLPKCPDY